MPDGDSDAKTALAAIEASRLGPAQKAALRLLAEGRSYREAARTADLKRHAQRFGIVEVHNQARGALVLQEREVRSAALMAELRQVAAKGARELLRRLDEEPESIQVRDLTVLTGVAMDKVAKWEGWSGDGDREEERQDRMAEFIERLSASGSTVTLAVQPRDPMAGAIVVTPERNGGG